MSVNPELFRWAYERSGKSELSLSQKFSDFDQWLAGEKSPTLKQLEEFAKATHTPFGFFFLPQPPVETLPIPDFRTLGSKPIEQISSNLLDTIYLCQQRQDWYRQNALLLGEPSLEFVGSATLQSDIASTAAHIRNTIGFNLDAHAEARTFLDAQRLMTESADRAGILVMVSGIVGHNSHRPLSTSEFRGFALSDDRAPLIFINGADTKSGQMFTLAHELAHLWLGESGVSDVTPASSFLQRTSRSSVERWCNSVAAEMLVPLEVFRQSYRVLASLPQEMNRLSRQYKVSTLVVLRRMLDAGGLTRSAFQSAFDAELKRLREEMERRKENSTGGDPYATGRVRVSPRFGKALIAATWEGRATFTEASRLLGFKSVKTIERFGEELGMLAYLRGGAV